MIKIFVNARFLSQSISGVQRYGIECSRQIKRLYPHVTFLAPDSIIHTDIATELDVKIIGIHKGQKWEQTDLVKYLKQNDNPPLLNLGNTAPIRYKNNYVTIHDLAFHRHPEWNSRLFSLWYNFLIPRIARRAKHIFTVSDTIRKEIEQFFHISPDKISVTYNGLSQHILKQGTSACYKKEKIILSVGTFSLRKNHHNLIKAYLESSLKEQYKLVIIGDKNKIFKEANIDEHMLQNSNVEMMQGLSDTQLTETYCKAEIIVSLSLYEGFGIPILEGLHFGCIALCSDIPVYHELYDKYAYFCNPRSINDIKNTIEKIANNEKSTSSLVSSQYDYAQSAKTIINSIVSNI